MKKEMNLYINENNLRLSVVGATCKKMHLKFAIH